MMFVHRAIYPTGHLITHRAYHLTVINCACYPPDHFIPPDILSHREFHHPPRILFHRACYLLSYGHLITHRACHPAGHLIAHRVFYPTRHVIPRGILSHGACHYLPGISLPSGNVIPPGILNLIRDLWQVLKTPQPLSF